MTAALSPGLFFRAGQLRYLLNCSTQDGHVLYAEDPDPPWYPASLTKMMTAYIAFEAMRDRRVTKETKIFISPNAHEQPPTRLGLGVGKDLPLWDALQALIMRSANDIAVAVAETSAATSSRSSR